MLGSGGWQASPHAHSTSWVIPLHGQENLQEMLPLSHSPSFMFILTQTMVLSLSLAQAASGGANFSTITHDFPV